MAPLLLITTLVATASPAPTVCAEDGLHVPVRLEAEATANEVFERLYRSGEAFSDFLEAATRRRALWVGNYREGLVDDGLLARARALEGRWYILAIAVDSCSDSVSTLPYLALLDEAVPGLEMRIVTPRAGRELMDTRRTPDGRTATPTFVLLDEDFEDAGCFIERPRDLQAWWAENEGKLDAEALYEGKMEWYARDGGRSTVEEVVELLEAAAAGEPRCDASE